MVEFVKLTKFFAKNDDELVELDRIVKFDKEPKTRRLDAIYVVAGTKDTGNSRGSIREAFKRVIWLYRGGYAPIVLALRGTTEHGYAGYEYYEQNLRRLGFRIPAKNIVPVDLLPEDEERKELNTYTESKALIAYCVQHGIGAIYLVDASFHQRRAGTSIISNLDRENPELWIFNKIAQPPPWNIPILHSQGVLADTLAGLELRELGRLFQYHDQGFLVSCSEVLDYYRKRDKVFGL